MQMSLLLTLGSLTLRCSDRVSAFLFESLPNQCISRVSFRNGYEVAACIIFFQHRFYTASIPLDIQRKRRKATFLFKILSFFFFLKRENTPNMITKYSTANGGKGNSNMNNIYKNR